MQPPIATNAAAAAPVHIARIDVSSEDYAGELDLRYRVLRAPLGMGRETVPFSFEDEAWHFVALDEGGRVVGCVLFYQDAPDGGRLFQMAVDPDLQTSGVGRALVHHLEAAVSAAGLSEIHLHARDTAMGFYERIGYVVTGAPFVEVGLGHHMMARTLGSP